MTGGWRKSSQSNVRFSGKKMFPQKKWQFPNGLKKNSRDFLKQKGDIPANSKPRKSTKALFQLTLPETNSSHLKIGHPRRKVVFQPSIFRCYVRFPRCISFKKYVAFWGWMSKNPCSGFYRYPSLALFLTPFRSHQLHSLKLT